MESEGSRGQRLHKHFQDIVSGKIRLSPGKNAKQFLEAICQKPKQCFTAIMTKPVGVSALLDTLRFDLSSSFFNTHIPPFVRSLQDKNLADTNNGVLFSDLLNTLSSREMVIFWMEFRKAFLAGGLDENGNLAFGWLYLKISKTQNFVHHDTDVSSVVARLTSSNDTDILDMGQQIQQILTMLEPSPCDMSFESQPGGRHDNDHADFRKISILPTESELRCDFRPSLRRSSFLEDPETEHNRVKLHVDNQFRLSREDMLSELKEEFRVQTGKKVGRQRIRILSLQELVGPQKKHEKWGLVFVCESDSFPDLSKKGKKERLAFLKDRPGYFKHQSLTCLMADESIIGFASINRDEERLVKNPPEIVLQFEDMQSMKRALPSFRSAKELTLFHINTAVFAFEPILRGLQQTTSLALSNELLLWKEGDVLTEVDVQAWEVLEALQSDNTIDLKPILHTPKSIKLDPSQVKALTRGLTQKVSLIQGPPGTGKSFIGALIAKAIHKFTDLTILVVCFTNHALDDILEGLLDIGISQEHMLRLGGKCTQRTEPLSITKQGRPRQRSKEEWDYINSLEVVQGKLFAALNDKITACLPSSSHSRLRAILDWLEFWDGDLDFFNTFQVPDSRDGFNTVGSGKKRVPPVYLLDRWQRGQDAGIFKNSRLPRPKDWKPVWALPLETRRENMRHWEEEMLQETVDDVYEAATAYNEGQQRLLQACRSNTTALLRRKSIVACTTTAAAKYREEIRAFNPGVLLVEEAGEVLESHVLMSLGPETKQMILIGDHKQLRPKVNNFGLTVEKGDGFDLNRSLFERLILRGYPHATLSQQHRMRPEISALVRRLTYPELIDAPKTENRPDIRGVRDNIIFVNHDQPEDEFKRLADRRDMASAGSKQNSHEANMVWKIVRYLGQQGYTSKDFVILTPYLGQLQRLREILKKENDPVLNDLDSRDLIQAGLLRSPFANSGKSKKKPIRLSTIDNYQGEESDIVIVSLTRSNSKCEIGFMCAPERLNVLLSRARNGLIMLGNATTFRNARKGGELWQNLFEMLERDDHMYEGLPVECVRHPNNTTVLSTPKEFDEHCPDGGCPIPCGTKLACGVHDCQKKCHDQRNHFLIKCDQNASFKCPAGHTLVYKCVNRPPITCRACEREKRLVKERQQRDLEEQRKRDEEHRKHQDDMDKLNADIERERNMCRDAKARKEREQALLQKKQDLNNLKNQLVGPPTPPTTLSQVTNVIPTPPNQFSLQSSGTPATMPASVSVPHVAKSSIPTTPSSLSQSAGIVPATMPSISVASQGAIIRPTLPGNRFKQLDPSPSKQEWDNQKGVEGTSNTAIDTIMGMTGLEKVKRTILDILAKIETAERQNVSIKRERFHVSFLGNPGTGKTTVARQYAKFLASVQAVPGDTFEEVTGASLANKGVDAAEKLLDSVTATGGIIFVDEAYQLTSGNNPGGAAVLDYLLAEMENRVGQVVFIFAGYSKEMEKFFDHNPGLKSRVPYEFHFTDYKDEELMAMFNGMIDKTFGGRMKVEDGVEGLYGRIVIRRLGRKRGCPGFGNARDLENIISKIRGRQAARLKSARQTGIRPDDYLLTAEDLIGPDPSVAILQSEAYEKLKKMIGLGAVKEAVSSFVKISSDNFIREISEKEPINVTLNRVFLGSPGTGKTTVAKLYGQILSDIGMLSNGEVVVKNPSDFVGSVIGGSEAQTKAILANSAGKVLIIDEAYMLYGGGGKGDNAGQSNQYKTSVIDTIVAEVQNTPGEDRCVLLLGYKDQMMEMFQNVNPGLSRRFKIEDAFNFEDFTDDELLSILDKKLKEQDLSATTEAKKVAIECLARMRNRPNFGNAGEVENLITQAKTRAMQRRGKMPASELTNQVDITFIQEDFDPDCNREQNAAENLTKLFEDVVGHESIIQRLKDYQQVARTCKARNLEPRDQVPMNFIFTGPPGTGKTTIARKVGQVFYDMGLLSAAGVVECSASDLVGQFVGQTGPKTKALFEKALGKVLFVDEAYRLGQGLFAQEAIDEVVGLITHPSFKGKLVIVLAGYEEDMNNLMSVNTGLASRFPHQVVFPNMSAEECMKVIQNELKKKGVEIDGWEDESSDFAVNMKELIRDLKKLPDWGNARDMVTLAKEMVSIAFLGSNDTEAQNQTGLKLASNEALDAVKKMIEERQRRAKLPNKRVVNDLLPVQSKDQKTRPTSLGTDTFQATSLKGDMHPSNEPPMHDAPIPSTPQVQCTQHKADGGDNIVGRDPGVSDEIWGELIDAQQQALTRDRRAKQELKALEERVRHAAQGEKERALAELRAREEAERQRQEWEEKVQSRLREIGNCVAGFQWINMGRYYRCAGGSHVVSISDLADL